MNTPKIKFFAVFMAFSILVSFAPSAAAEGFKQGTASLLLPTTGQAMNGELGSKKTKLMAGVEVAAITAVTVIGFAGGGPAVWFGAGPLLANHLYSSVDAYRTAKRNGGTASNQDMLDAQRNIEYSRERRYEREQAYRSDIRDRIARAGEQGGR